MEILKLIEGRKSIRSYDADKKIADEFLIQILEAGRMAPSAANRQPWHFYVISEAQKLAAVKECYKAPWFKNAPHILVVVGNKDEAWKRKHDNYNAIETDLTIAMDHMILAATAMSIGTCWIAAFDADILSKAMNLKESEVIYAITPLGYSEADYLPKLEKDRKPANEVYTII